MTATNWIQALAELDQKGTPAVLVTIVEQRGSTPRNNGSKMVVSSDHSFDTIGGGHLEYQAIRIARQLLEDEESQPRLESFSLGASLGQCCGGAHTLLFEPVRRIRLNIALFGAGHIGRALAPILATLPCNLRWIDSREQQFPSQIPAGVERLISDYPVDEVEELPAGSYFIVMTHNHQLDLQLAEKILSRGDFSYFGLIGSRSKRKRFEHRLRAKGFTAEQMAAMICPLGMPGVKGKLPAEIAVAVAAEIIATYNRDFGTHRRAQGASNKAVKVSRLSC